MSDSYLRGNYWYDKGFSWYVVAVSACIPNLVLWVINDAVADASWSVALVLVQLAILAAQIAAGVRMGICYRRATKAWRGAR